MARYLKKLIFIKNSLKCNKKLLDGMLLMDTDATSHLLKIEIFKPNKEQGLIEN